MKIYKIRTAIVKYIPNIEENIIISNFFLKEENINGKINTYFFYINNDLKEKKSDFVIQDIMIDTLLEDAISKGKKILESFFNGEIIVSAYLAETIELQPI